MTSLDESLRALVRELVREEIARVPATSPALERAPGAPDAEYIDERALATWIDVSRETLKQMRARGDGPPFLKVARRAVRYHVPSVREWLATRQRGR